MPHVSKKKLDQDLSDKIFSQLVGVMIRAQDKKKFIAVLDELFTATEKKMLAKRLAVILLLFGDIPQERIAEGLAMSPATISRMSLKVEVGKYDAIKYISKKEKVDLEKVLWLLLTAGGMLPPRVGRKYWRSKGLKAFLEP